MVTLTTGSVTSGIKSMDKLLSAFTPRMDTIRQAINVVTGRFTASRVSDIQKLSRKQTNQTGRAVGNFYIFCTPKALNSKAQGQRRSRATLGQELN